MWLTYFLLKMDDIRGMLACVQGCLGICILAITVTTLVTFDAVEETVRQRLVEYKVRAMTIICVILGFVTALLPSTKQLAAMYVVSNPSVKEIAGDMGDIAKLGTTYLKNMLEKELKQDVNIQDNK